MYIELPCVLLLRVRNIWHAGATVEELSGVFDTRLECENAGCCVLVVAARLLAEEIFMNLKQFTEQFNNRDTHRERIVIAGTGELK